MEITLYTDHLLYIVQVSIYFEKQVNTFMFLFYFIVFTYNYHTVTKST